jgi:hypothetical protein
VTWLLSAIFFLTLISCHSYNPALYPSYDVLNPGQEVRINPIKVNDDGTYVVNEAFLIWVYELRMEIIKLRKK